jgi:hypothetical protein
MTPAARWYRHPLAAIGGTLIVLAAGIALAWLALPAAAAGALAPPGSASSLPLLATATALLAAGCGLFLLASRRARGARVAVGGRTGPEVEATPAIPAPRQDAPTAGRRPAPGPRKHDASNVLEALHADQVSSLRAQIDLLCSMIGAGSTGEVLQQELRTSGAGAIAIRAMTMADASARTVGSAGIAQEFAEEGIFIAPAVVAGLQLDLAGISRSLATLAARCGYDPVHHPGRALSEELHDQVTAQLGHIQRLLMESTLLLTAVTDLAALLVEHCGRLRRAAQQRAAQRQAGPDDLAARQRDSAQDWSPAPGDNPFADLDFGADGEHIPARKLN